MRAGVLTAAEGRAGIGQSLGSRSITSLVRVPRLFAVVTEQSSTAGPLACQLWTTRTARCYYYIPAAAHKMLIVSYDAFKMGYTVNNSAPRFSAANFAKFCSSATCEIPQNY